ncbi:MAG: polysulfide reductase NrfD, partial [Acetobacteraceae bacterium]|nr:polysulfide reductase NrfD [Acetobacteraceae bacterium]
AGVALREKTRLWWWALFLLALAMLGWGAFSVGWLFANGIEVWGNNWPVMWGFPLINYVWWIGIASGGTLISSLFFITRAKWRSGISRIAETVTLFAAACAGIYPLIHLGRPWFFYWLFPYPNTMTLWPQFRSPLLWDFIAVITYILCSVMFWVLGALPDFASLRDRATWRPAQIFYGILAMGFRGTGPQWRRFHAAYATIASIMAPLVCSVHSVVGLDFAGAAFPGWYSTQFPPFFVVGAVLSGFGVVLMLVVPLRVALGLKPDITERHLEVLGRLTLTTSLCLTYCYMMDAFDPFYAGEKAEIVQFMARVSGLYGWIYWLTITLNCVVPQLLWSRRLRNSPVMLWFIGWSVFIGMWFERFQIVEVQLHRPRLPSAWGIYIPTVWDFGVFAGTAGLFLAGILLFVRTMPVIPISEMRELIQEGVSGDPS